MTLVGGGGGGGGGGAATTTDVKRAPAMLRGMHLACEDPKALPPASVLRLVVLSLGDAVPEVLRAKDSRRLAALGLRREYVSALFRALPDAARLQAARDLMLVRLSGRLAEEALKAWGTEAPARVRRDPYGAVFELKGTLEDADAAWTATRDSDDSEDDGIHKRAAQLAQMARWMLMTGKREGHTMLPTAAVVARLASHLRLDVDVVRQALARAVDAGVLVLVGRPGGDDEGLAEPEVVRNETRVARECRERAGRATLPRIRVPEDAGLSPEQLAAVDVVCAASLSIVTGGPGTGKTTLVRALVAALGEERCMLTAPTGRAARNVGGATVHSASGGRLLRRRPIQETVKADVPDDLALMVVDEASMLSTELMVGVLSLAPRGCHVVLVGDADQLPPVGAGNAFRDLLESGLVPVARLTHNHRSVSAVQRLAAAVLAGDVPRDAVPDLVEARGRDAIMRAVVGLVVADPPARQVLTPHNATRAVLNRAVQSALRPVPVRMHDGTVWGLPKHACGTLTTSPDGTSTLRFDDKSLTMAVDHALTITAPRHAFLVDDAVMVLKNQNKKRLREGEASACNGDVGVLTRQAPKPCVAFGDGSRADFASEDWLCLAYAATVHKFQGSECEDVVLPVPEPVMWDRHMLYTAITRAKSRAFVVGTLADLRAVAARARPRRHSALAALLATPTDHHPDLPPPRGV